LLQLLMVTRMIQLASLWFEADVHVDSEDINLAFGGRRVFSNTRARGAHNPSSLPEAPVRLPSPSLARRRRWRWLNEM